MVEGPVSNRRFSRRQMRTAIMISVAVILIFVIGGGGWALYSKITSEAEKAALEAREGMARDIATHTQTKLASIKNQLNALAKDETTISLFQQDDNSEALLAAAEEKQGSFENSMKLRYLKPGQYDLDEVSVPPLSYASLDMLKKAETNSQINSEVHMFGTPNQHIVMIERVVNKSFELIGLLHLSLDTVLLEGLLLDIDLAGGYAELAQRGSGKALVLAKAGNSSARQGEATTVGVSDTRWIIAYWPSGGVVASASEDSGSGLPILPILIVLLIVGGAVFFLAKKKGQGSGKQTDEDQVTYEGAVRAIAEGAHAGVEHMIPHLPKGERITANLKPISQGMTGDDVTMIASSSEAKKEKSTPAVKQEPVDSEATTVDLEANAEQQQQAAAKKTEVDPVIFRTYDIRGVFGESLTEEVAHEIGLAIGTMAHERGQQGIVVGRDCRVSSPAMAEALIKGLRASGRDVIDIGLVPTPLLYFATHHLETGSGVMITGSHNPPEYNGLKIMLGGSTLSGEEIKEIQERVIAGEHTTGQGDLRHADIAADYVRRISEDIPVALGSSFKIVVDCGNGAAGTLAPQLLNAIGHDIVEMYCDMDGSFPNHQPDPSQPENLKDLIERVKTEGADIGFAFDGDGDRLGVVDANGNIIWPDRQLMLLAKDVLSRNSGAEIIFDVKCSRYLKSIIETNGGKPLMWKTGHSLIKNKMKEVDAPLAGEMSGHIFFKERWYGFDDAIYTAARLIEVFTNAKDKPTELFEELPDGVSTPELRVPLDESEHAGFMEELIGKMSVSGAEVIDIDGLRIEYSDGWGLARPSNTSPYIVLRFEGESEEVLERIKAEFRASIQLIKPDIEIPF